MKHTQHMPDTSTLISKVLPLCEPTHSQERRISKVAQEAKTHVDSYVAKLRYSDHPYVEVFVKKVRVNVVPCYDVEQSKWQSAADRSPFHTRYISSNFDDEKRRQARLLKKFLKSVGIYGAEISTEGFSGYVSEVLVLKYSSFENLLKNHRLISSKKANIAVGQSSCFQTCL